MRRPASVEIRRTARGPIPRIRFGAIASRVLGKRYELSLVICGDALARRMNRLYRRKRYAPNVLSFPLGTHEGEIFLNLECARREAKRYKVPLRARLALLFVHACYHLRGFRHGAVMERLERAALKKSGF